MEFSPPGGYDRQQERIGKHPSDDLAGANDTSGGSENGERLTALRRIQISNIGHLPAVTNLMLMP
jgi:hypothetical protein